MLSIATIIGISNGCLVLMALTLYLMIIVIIIKSRRELRDISYLLICHTCLAVFMVCITVCVMISSNLFSGFLLLNMKFCYVWGLFYDIFECSVYYSYCLQAFYRLCRIVFYRKKYLLSYSLYIILIIVQWIIVLILLLPPIFINWYARLPREKYCLIPYTYIGPEIYHILVVYLIPLICLTIIYIWITTYMRSVSQTPTLLLGAVQRLRNQRDYTVFKRILILMLILIILRFPTVIFMIHGAISKSLYSFTYGIVGLITSICFILIGTITINITSQLRKSFLEIFLHQNNLIEHQPVLLHNTTSRVAPITKTNTFQKNN